MSVGVNAWNIANPVLSNVDKVLLAVHDVVAGETEIEFGSDLITSKYSSYMIKLRDVIGVGATFGLNVTLSIAGVYIAGTAYSYSSIGNAVVAGQPYMKAEAGLSTALTSPAVGEIVLTAADVAQGISASLAYSIFDARLGEMFVGGGIFSSVGAIDGIKITPNTAGTFTTGKFNLYGIPKT